MTGGDPRLISPADILDMREGDVSSVKIAGQPEEPAAGRARLQR